MHDCHEQAKVFLNDENLAVISSDMSSLLTSNPFTHATKLSPVERYSKTTNQCPRVLLGVFPGEIGLEKYMETVHSGVGIGVGLNLREETHSGGSETKRYDTSQASRRTFGCRSRWKRNTREISQTGKDKVNEGLDEVVHGFTLEFDLDSDGHSLSELPRSCGLFGSDDLDTG